MRVNEQARVWSLLVDLLFDRREPAALAARVAAEAEAVPRLWRLLISRANANLVTGGLYSALRRHELLGSLADAEVDYLASFHELNGARNRSVLGQVFELTQALNRIGVEPMPLKGAAYLLAKLYDDAGDRFLTDIDFLIPPDSVGTVSRAMAGLGYRPAGAPGFDYSKHHHLAPLVRDGDAAAVEVHLTPVPRFAAPALPAPRLWAVAESRSEAGVRYARPSASDAAMLSFLHAVVIDRGLVLFLLPLRPFEDIHRLQARYGADIDWDFNRQRARAIGAQGRLRRYLYLLERLSGRPPLLEGLAARKSDAVYFSICRAALGAPAITRWSLRMDRLSDRRLRDEYGIEGGALAVNRQRLKELAAMVFPGDASGKREPWSRREPAAKREPWGNREPAAAGKREPWAKRE